MGILRHLWLLAVLVSAPAADSPRVRTPALVELATVLGDVQWGMSPEQTRRALHGRAIAPDGLAPDHTTLLTARDQGTQTFYVFDAGALATIYQRVEAVAFPEGNFDAFTRALERRLGPGRRQREEGSFPTRLDWVEWRDRDTRLRAFDPIRFGGAYCLIFGSSKRTNSVPARSADTEEDATRLLECGPPRRN